MDVRRFAVGAAVLWSLQVFMPANVWPQSLDRSPFGQAAAGPEGGLTAVAMRPPGRIGQRLRSRLEARFGGRLLGRSGPSANPPGRMVWLRRPPTLEFVPGARPLPPGDFDPYVPDADRGGVYESRPYGFGPYADPYLADPYLPGAAELDAYDVEMARRAGEASDAEPAPYLADQPYSRPPSDMQPRTRFPRGASAGPDVLPSEESVLGRRQNPAGSYRAGQTAGAGRGVQGVREEIGLGEAEVASFDEPQPSPAQVGELQAAKSQITETPGEEPRLQNQLVEPEEPAAIAASRREPPADGGQLGRRINFVDLARVDFRAGDYTQAAKFFRHALVEDENNPAILQLLAQTLFATGRYAETGVLLRDGLAALTAEQWQSLAQQIRQLYGRAEEYRAQVARLEQAVASNPDSADLRFLLAYQYAVQGREPEALAQLDLVRQNADDDEAARQLELLIDGRSVAKLDAVAAGPAAATELQNDQPATPAVAEPSEAAAASPPAAEGPLLVAPEVEPAEPDADAAAEAGPPPASAIGPEAEDAE